MRGKTILKGHGLRAEGRRRYNADDTWDPAGQGSARCSCGALSEPGITVAAAMRWHAAHKDALRGA